MSNRRMNNKSRRSFFRAGKATIIGHDDCWRILLSEPELNLPYTILNKHRDESWWVKSGNLAVTYSSSYAAIQAIQRIRTDLPWTISESKPESKNVVDESPAPKAIKEHTTKNIQAAARAQAVLRTDEKERLSEQNESENKAHYKQSVKNELSNDQLNEMARRVALVLTELGHTPSSPEELNKVLKIIKELSAFTVARSGGRKA